MVKFTPPPAYPATGLICSNAPEIGSTHVTLPVILGKPALCELPNVVAWVEARKYYRAQAKISIGKALRASCSSVTAGTTNEAGLPNITGNSNDLPFESDSYPDFYGAFYDSKGYSPEVPNNPSFWENLSLGFDASRSSEIYGRSTTVMPESINSPCIIYLGK